MFTFVRGICVALASLCVTGSAYPQDPSPIVERLTAVGAVPKSGPVALRLARASLHAASLTGEAWDDVSGNFKDRVQFPSPQAPNLVALVSPGFAEDSGLTYDYWLVAYQLGQSVGLAKAAFRALGIYQSREDLIGKSAGSLAARVLALQPVENAARERPLVKSVEFECRPLSTGENGVKVFLLESVITLCAKPNDEAIERLRFGAEIRVRQRDGNSWDACVTTSSSPHIYLREADGAEVFYELGGLRVN